MLNKSLDLNKLRILTYPEPLLRRPAEPVSGITEEIIAITYRMMDVMVGSSGVGLAATQLGVPLRIMVISPSGKKEDAQALINPELSDFTGWQEMEEGCLSVPGIRAKVRRAANCIVKALDIQGRYIQIDAANLVAVIVQHECDHLEGKLFIDRLNTLSRIAIHRNLKQLEEEFTDK